MTMSIASISDRLAAAGYSSLEDFFSDCASLLTIGHDYDPDNFIADIPLDDCLAMADYIDLHYVPIGPECRSVSF